MSRVKNYLLSKGWSDDQIKSLQVVRNYFFRINWIKTIWFNFKALPFNQAIRIPFVIGSNVKIRNVGNIKLYTNASIGLVSIAVNKIDSLETNASQTIFTNDGLIYFAGRAKFHPGAKIVVNSNATLSFGNRVSIGSMTKIVCSKQITFHNDVRISWDGQVFDTDFHFLTNLIKNKIYPRLKPIEIEDEVFIGNSCTIGKGTYIPKGSVVSCCSKVSGSLKEEGENLLIAGNPSKILAKGFKMGSGWFPEVEIEISHQLEE